MPMLKTHMLSLAAAAVMLTSGAAMADGPLFRHAAEFFKFDGTEFATAITANADPTIADGALFYVRTVILPSNSNVLYVTIFATGDQHGGGGALVELPVGSWTGLDQLPSGSIGHR